MRTTMLLALLVFTSCKDRLASEEAPTFIEMSLLDADTSLPPPYIDTEEEVDQRVRGYELNNSLPASKGVKGNESPKLVRDIYLVMEVQDYKTSRKKLEQLFNDFKIRLHQVSENRESEKIENHTYIEIQPELLDSLVTAIEQIGLKIDQKNVTVGDRTHEYLDLEVRVASKRALIEQYQRLLKTSKNMTDVLAIYEKLNEETANMESFQADLNNLRGKVKFSAINLTFYEMLDDTSTIKPKNFWQQAQASLVVGWQRFVQSILFLVGLWPFLVLLPVVVVAGIQGIRKLRKSTVESV